MGMNKQFRVSFDVTATMSNEQERDFMEALVKLGAMSIIKPRRKHILKAALTEGPEAAFESMIKEGLREAVKDLVNEMQCGELAIRFSPATVRIKR